MAEVVLDRLLTEAEWEALEDPVGGRYEILDGRLVMTPSGDANHSRYGEDLANMFRLAAARAGLDLPITTDVEWRTVSAGVVAHAPRGDVVIGRSLDPERDIHDEVPLLVAEVWSSITRPSIVSARRSYWQRLGLEHYWEIRLGSTREEAEIVVWDLVGQRVVQQAAGRQQIEVAQPFPIEVVPAEIHGWAVRQLQEAEAEIERLRRRLRELGAE